MSGSGSETRRDSVAERRRDELLEAFGELDEGRRLLAERLVDEMVFLEERMAECRECAFIEVNAKGEQRQTPAWRIYKDCLAQYTNNVRVLLSMSGKDGEEKKDSPLRAYFRELAKNG